jgi:hypothetical protein
MGQEFKSTDLEIGIVTVDNPIFRKLTIDEIEKHLNDISQKDWLWWVFIVDNQRVKLFNSGTL